MPSEVKKRRVGGALYFPPLTKDRLYIIIGHMRTIILGGKSYTILTQQEKAQEQGILPRQLRRRLLQGLIPKNQIVSIPTSTKVWYLAEGQEYDGDTDQQAA